MVDLKANLEPRVGSIALINNIIKEELS